MSDKETEAVYDLAALAQTYLQRAEAAEALLAQRTARSEAEVRGYVVMSKGGSGEPLLAYLDLYRTRERAEHVAETLRDGVAYGLPADPEAHVGVVTALPTQPADVEAFRVAFWSDPERAAAMRARMAEIEGGAPVEVDDPAEIQRRLDALAALPDQP